MFTSTCAPKIRPYKMSNYAKLLCFILIKCKGSRSYMNVFRALSFHGKYVRSLSTSLIPNNMLVPVALHCLFNSDTNYSCFFFFEVGTLLIILFTYYERYSWDDGNNLTSYIVVPRRVSVVSKVTLKGTYFSACLNVSQLTSTL